MRLFDKSVGDYMIPIVCIENNYGMLFNKRRVSKDSELMKWLINYTQSHALWYNSYSEKLFEDVEKVTTDIILKCDDEFINKAKQEDYCFIENIDISQYKEYYNEIIVCKWNRNYPSDFRLKVKEEDILKKDILAEIKGSSHEKITIELWKI